jgi:murein DD-endopeptidase MepM/ murein hydrolase activator NlpD
MKKTITEELERIHKLTYGEKVMNESDFMSRILKALGIKNKNEIKVDDPKKSDYLTDNVDDFYETLNNVISDGGLSQQSSKDYEYQKEVEAMQIGLELLGYSLPEHGVDGLFGPETASAVKKFINDKMTNKDTDTNDNNDDDAADDDVPSLNEAVLMSPLENGMGSGGNYGVHRKGLDRAGKKHSGVDLHAKYEPVLSPADGVVIDSAIRDNACGGTLYIDHQNGFKSRFCHLKKIYVSKGDNVTQGEEVAMSGGGKNDGISRGHSTGPHLHFELYKNNKLVNPRDYVGSELPKGDVIKKNNTEKTKKSDDKDSSLATPEMLQKLIELLKTKNITSDDLKKYLDKSIISDYKGSNNDDFYKAILTCIGAPVTNENMLFMYAWRQAEGGVYRNNPFNTKKKFPNATGEGVKNYQTPQDGINATCETLKLSYYTCIVDGLKNDIGALNISQKCNSSLYTWGTHHTNPLVTDVLKSYQSGNSPNPKPISA